MTIPDFGKQQHLLKLPCNTKKVFLNLTQDLKDFIHFYMRRYCCFRPPEMKLPIDTRPPPLVVFQQPEFFTIDFL